MGGVISAIAPSESNHYKTTAIVASSAVLAAAHLLPGNLSNNDGLVNLAHLSSFAIWFGTQFWVTAVAGITKVKILPRSWFAKVQRVLFDRYFMGGFILNNIMLATFLIKHPYSSWEDKTSIMGNILIASSCLVGLNGFVVKPWVTTTGRKMNEFEADRGYGNEPGPIKGEIVNDPKYIEIKKDFIKAHAASALINVVNMGFSIFHTWYLANRISF